MRQPNTTYPPGHRVRAKLRQLLQDLGATGVELTFESRGGQYRLLTYGTRPARHRLADGATSDLKAFAMAQLRQGLPPKPDPARDGRRGNLSWNLQEDRVEVSY